MFEEYQSKRKQSLHRILKRRPHLPRNKKKFFAVKKIDRFALSFADRWGHLPVDPKKNFEKLTRPERANLVVRFGSSSVVVLPFRRLRNKARFREFLESEGFIAPASGFFAIMTDSASPAFAAKEVSRHLKSTSKEPITRRRNQGLLSQLYAWDLKQEGKSWSDVGRALQKKNLIPKDASKDALIKFARDQYASGAREIRRGPWR